MFNGKRIVVGVSGGIAAYKAAELVSRLRKAGADVHVVMTANAGNFVGKLTFQSLSGNPVHVDMFGESKLGGIEHIELSQKADLIIIAPATANVIAKAAVGIADDLLSTLLLAHTAPVLLAPAMNSQMYINPATQANLCRLREYGYQISEPNQGFLACGTEGPGRMAEPAEIFAQAQAVLSPQRQLAGKTVLVTAGGTQEAIDPVRFIGNRSSGKMGYALASAAVEAGARVVLISAPSALQPPAGVEFISVVSAQEMYQAVMERFPNCDIVIKAAAVADYRPLQVAEHKIKKNSEKLALTLVRNPDILSDLGKIKGKQILVGFAAETNDLQAYALDKVKRKNLDLLVANDVTNPNAGFGSDTNVVSIVYASGRVDNLPVLPKQEVAREVIRRIGCL